MFVPICTIKLGPNRRRVEPGNVKELAASIAQIGLLNPITVTPDHTLIAGAHRLEAMKLLGWSEIACTICDLDTLLVELAEIDENFMRTNLSVIEFGDLLLRRKEIYETLHPETKRGMRNGQTTKNDKVSVLENHAFSRDTADKLGVSPRTVERQIQTAKNLSPKAKWLFRHSEVKISKTDALKLSRLEPEQQEDAAHRLIAGEIHSVDDYKKPYSLRGKAFASLEESIADLKNPNKDASYTPDTLLADMDGFIERFYKDFSWYSKPMCTSVFPQISSTQLSYIKERFIGVASAVETLIETMEGSVTTVSQ